MTDGPTGGQRPLLAPIPTPLADKMRAAGAGERRPVTAVFADVVNSTALTASMDPEDWTEIINDTFARLSQVIYRYEGTIARLMGDAILAFFGAPVAHEDDPERAVRCGLDMVASIDELGVQLRATRGIDLTIRAGINTGPVVVGTVGSDLMYEYTAMGDAINVAARMQSAARPGTVLVTAATFRFIAPLFDAVELDPLTVKGKAEPVLAYEIIGPKDAPGPTRGLAGLASAMVGRDAEMSVLSDAMSAVRAGRGRAACVVAEPGIGKTRLIAELRPRAVTAGIGWAEGRCVPYGRALPYHLVARLVRSFIGVGPTAADAETLAALEARAGELLGADAPDVILYLQHLLGIRLSDENAERIAATDPALLQGRYFASLRQILRAAGARAPLALVCDDVQWADPASVEVLAEILALANELPLLMLVAARPERDTPGWGFITTARDLFGDAFAEINLRPLSRDDSCAQVANLLDIESLPGPMRELILERAEGNPLFIEEIIRTLIERAAVARSGTRWVATKGIDAVEVPDTLHGLLLARIDRLPDGAKRALRAASVIGRRFSLQTLERAMSADTAEPVGPAISALEASGLLRLTAVEPEVEYVFRHVLIQETAYASLLRQDRKRMHLRVADALQALHPEASATLAPVLAMHLHEAGDAERAVPFLLAAGREGAARYANHEARAAFERAVADLDTLEDTPARRRQRVEAVVGAVKAGWTFSPWDKDVASLEAVLPLAEDSGDLRLLAEAYFWVAYLRRAQGETEATSEPLRRALERSGAIGRELGDDSIGAIPLAFAAMGMLFAGEIREAVRMFESLLPVLQRHGDRMGAAMVAEMIPMGYARLGEFVMAERAGARSNAIAREADVMAILDAHINDAYVDLERGRLQAAADTARECKGDAEDAGALSCAVLSHYLIGMVDVFRGDVPSARSSLERASEIARSASLYPWRNRVFGTLSWARAMLGESRAEASSELDRAIEFDRQTRDAWDEGTLLTLRGTLRARSEDTREAGVEDFKAAAELFNTMGARPALVRTLRAWADALDLAGRHNDATEQRAKAHALAEEIGLESAA